MRFTVVLLLSTLVPAADLSPKNYLAHVKYLSSPELKGRMTGSPELEKAAAYIAHQFHSAGLKPIDGSYLQEFEVTAHTALGPGNKLILVISQRLKELSESRDFAPLNLSTNGETQGPIVFAGYGITAAEYHYDDYQKIDARGKVVLLMRHEPQEFDEKSIFAGKNYTMHSELASKVANAKLHGAAAILLVNDLPNHAGDDDRLDPFTPAMGTEDYGLPVVQISVKWANEERSRRHYRGHRQRSKAAQLGSALRRWRPYDRKRHHRKACRPQRSRLSAWRDERIHHSRRSL